MSILLSLLITIASLPGMPDVPSGWRAGIIVIDTQTDESIIDINSEEYFRPASTIKLLTSLSGMRELGPSYIWEMELLADTSDHTLYLPASGVPLLNAYQIEILAMETAATLEPDSRWTLVYDTSLFLAEEHLPGWAEHDWNKLYCSPVNALALGDNNLELIISSTGDSIRIFTYPPLPNLQLTSNITLGPLKRLTWEVGGWEDELPIINLCGTVRPGTVSTLYIPFAGAPFELTNMLALALESYGLEVDSIIRDTVPEDSLLFRTSVIYSDPLFTIMTSMNKWSRNWVAEMILRTVSLESGCLPASSGNGCEITGELLLQLLPGMTEFRLADASGLSRLNSLAPVHLAAVLEEGIASEEWGIEFLATLPVNGVDGTLRTRLEELPPGVFRGKTGTLSDTSSIAGLLHTSSGRYLYVVILLEYNSVSSLTARNWQDNLITWLYYTY